MSQTVTFSERRWGWKSAGEGISFILSSPIALPLSGLRVYIFAADWPLIKDHIPSAGGIDRRERRERGLEDV